MSIISFQGGILGFSILLLFLHLLNISLCSGLQNTSRGGISVNLKKISDVGRGDDFSLLRHCRLLTHQIRLYIFVRLQRSLILHSFLGIHSLGSVLQFLIELISLLLQTVALISKLISLGGVTILFFLAHFLLDSIVFSVSWAFPISSDFPIST